MAMTPGNNFCLCHMLLHLTWPIKGLNEDLINQKSTYPTAENTTNAQRSELGRN